jgi:lincosamide nucleotidyltransferase A/C/D/E
VGRTGQRAVAGSYGHSTGRCTIRTVLSASQVIEVMFTLREANVNAWVDGGWGVDALLEEQTRQHDDLDLVVAADSVSMIRSLLEAAGFVVERDWLPTALAMRHRAGHREIGAQSVLCCSPECQISAHLGYQPDDNDRADAARLAHRFGLAPPGPYQSG